jgi:deoxyribodipyrimidine photolyase
MSGTPFIYLFSHDLRLDDHAGLAAAAQRGPIFPVLSIEPDLSKRLQRSPRRAAFFAEPCVRSTPTYARSAAA